MCTAICKLMVEYQPRYAPQWIRLSKQSIKWVEYFTTTITCPEDYTTFYHVTRYRILTRSKREIREQFGVKIPIHVKQFKWVIQRPPKSK